MSARVTAILIGSGGELDRFTADVRVEDGIVQLDELFESHAGWPLTHGDVIKIEIEGGDA